MILFVDTFAFIAWLNVRDASHAAVKSFFAACTDRLLTTEWVLVELADALSHPRHRGAVGQLMQHIRTLPQFEIVPSDPRAFQAGFDLFIARPDKDWSLTDCISFAVMTQRGLTDALTADVHFEQAGFRAVFRTP
jgi:predicted nucleic acid-binding protein